jgi:hypothetical protein
MPHRSQAAGAAQRAAVDVAPFVRGLQHLVPPQRLESLLRRTARKEKRRRRLPASSVVWLVVAMTLFAHLSIPKAFRALHPSPDRPEPDDSAFTKARARLGVLPMRLLFDELSARLAPASLPGVCYRHWRLMGLDGSVFDLPDTPANVAVFGRQSNQRSPYAFPQLRVLALCELGTHQVHDFAFRPIDVAEQDMVKPLLRRLRPGMLLLWDRNFFSYQLTRAVLATGCELLARVKATQLVFKRIEELPDGSYLSKIYPSYADKQKDRNGLTVRIIEYTHDDANRPGCGMKHRLLTSVLDPEEMPAREAPVVYHERWEEELALDEIKTHLNGREVLLRSKTPRGVAQELYGMMLAHRVIRQVMLDAAQAKKADPDRLSFVNSLRVLQEHLPEAARREPANWYKRLVREVSWQELRPRRQRWYPRVVKRKMKKWDKKRPQHLHPPQPTKAFADAVVIT